MSRRSLFFHFVLAGIFTTASVSHAAQGSPNRDPRICKSGPKAGLACTDDEQCPASRCLVDYIDGHSKTFSAELTIIVDDDVSKFDESEEVTGVTAATILMKIESSGKEYFLAQTYQHLQDSGDLASFIAALQTGPILADTDKSRGSVDESNLNDALDPTFIGQDPTKSLMDDLRWQVPDGPMADELRRIFDKTGNIVMVERPRTLAEVDHSDYESSSLASVIRVKVKFGFVKP